MLSPQIQKVGGHVFPVNPPFHPMIDAHTVLPQPAVINTPVKRNWPASGIPCTTATCVDQ